MIHHGDCLDALRAMPDLSVDVVITDPPYSPEVHANAGKRSLKTVNGQSTLSRKMGLGFAPITPALIEACAVQFERLAKRWVLVFCDCESIHLWRDAFRSAGLEPIRVGMWVKTMCTPQFTGDRPAVAVEAIVIAHRKGRKRWNGGGGRAVWTHDVVKDLSDGRLHTTQKPIGLMLDLVRLFSDPGETILDPFAGSGTTGVAAARLGRDFVGVEKQGIYVATARERIAAEIGDSTLKASRAGQLALYGTRSPK